MYHYTKQMPHHRCEQYFLNESDQRLTFEDVAMRWQDDEEFRDFFVRTITDSPFQAVRWETPPVNALTKKREFEFVLLNTPALVRPIDRLPFAGSFQTNEPNQVVVFDNLGKDALLVVPGPAEVDDQFSHLSGFLKQATRDHVHHLWRMVGEHFTRRIAEQNPNPVWLSTAGMGVAWLHVRMDTYPKYYGHSPYREWNV